MPFRFAILVLRAPVSIHRPFYLSTLPTPSQVEEFVSGCFDELQLSQRYVPYVKKAEEAGYQQIAKLFRAMVASETVRETLFRKGIPNKNAQPGDYYVCPHCGLIYDRECPEQCVADALPGCCAKTPGAEFIIIK